MNIRIFRSKRLRFLVYGRMLYLEIGTEKNSTGNMPRHALARSVLTCGSRKALRVADPILEACERPSGLPTLRPIANAATDRRGLGGYFLSGVVSSVSFVSTTKTASSFAGFVSLPLALIP